MKFIPYTIDRYDEVMVMLSAASGVAIRDVDSRESTIRYLERNPNLRFLAEDKGRVVGCAMCGHDGRRGYLQHVFVTQAYRNQGVAQTLTDCCLDRLEEIGILKTHIDVFVSNSSGNSYWLRRGWKRRDDIYRYSMNRSKSEKA